MDVIVCGMQVLKENVRVA